jgi:hypothetical protein
MAALSRRSGNGERESTARPLGADDRGVRNLLTRARPAGKGLEGTLSGTIKSEVKS